MCYYKIKIPDVFHVRDFYWILRRNAAQGDTECHLNRFFIFSRKDSSWAVSLSLRSSASFW